MNFLERLSRARGLARAGVIAVACGAMALGGAAGRAADEPTVTAERASLSGFWKSASRGVGNGERLGLPRGGPALEAMVPKLQPWAAAEHTKDMAAQAAGEYRPTAQMKCFPEHVPGTGLPQFSGNIGVAVEPGQVTFMYEVNRIIRLAYFNQQHPVPFTPGWLGHSIARWDGNTLIVDTVGFNSDMHLDRGIPMTARMHIVQQMRIVDGQLEIKATFDDPGAFTGPFTITNMYVRSEPFQEYICPENNQEGGVPTSTGQPTKPVLPLGSAKPTPKPG